MAIFPGFGMITATVSGTIETQDVALNNNSKIGYIYISTIAKLINVSGTNLIGRKSIILQNVSSLNIYISNINTIDVTDTTTLVAGATLSLSLDQTENVNIYGFTIGGTAKLSVMEV